MKSHYKKIWICGGCFFIILVIFFMGQIVNKQINGISRKPTQTRKANKIDKPIKKSKKKLTQMNVLRIEQKSPQSKYTESIIFIDKEEAARFKSKDGKIFNLSGHIPDGKIKFVNEWGNTYGYEHYRKGKKDGDYIEYYNSNQIKAELKYNMGKIVRKKTYYINGVIHKEVDYSNSRFVSYSLKDNKDIDDVGVGKIYRIDGSLKYEWHFVDVAEKNFTKRYDREGDLIEVNYYTAQGELLEQGMMKNGKYH